MEKLSINVILSVSVPEQILYVLTVLLMVARLDLIRPNKENMFKITVVTLINTAFVVWLRGASANFLLNVVLQVAFMAFTYVAILRINAYETIVASLLSYFEFFTIEFVTSVVLIWAFNLDFEKIFNSDFARIIITLPIRALEIGVLFALVKSTIVVVNLKPIKHTLEFFKSFTFLAICLFLGLMQVAGCIKFTVFDLKLVKTPESTSFLMGTVAFISVLFISVFATIKKIHSIEEHHKNNYFITLKYVKDCLRRGEIGIKEVDKMVDTQLKELGFKMEENPPTKP